MPPAVSIELSEDERAQLESWARRRTSAQAPAQRSRIVLPAADGLNNTEIAERLGVYRPMVRKWRGRFAAGRLDALVDEPRPGRPRTIVKTLEAAPKNATHWSTRSMAAETGLSREAVGRIWRAFGLQPHRQETWKLSKDPLFVEKVRDVVGLYLNPPERADVLCVDEKSQIQALDRTAPVLPMLPGTPERATHDYKRHGTSSLYAALDLATGKVIGELRSRHRAIEFKQFLQTLDREVPQDAGDQEMARRSPRFVLHFTPASSSWLNLVERWFAELTTKKLQRSAHRSLRALNKDIREWIETWNDDPKPYVWTRTADQILESIATYCNRITVSRSLVAPFADRTCAALAADSLSPLSRADSTGERGSLLRRGVRPLDLRELQRKRLGASSVQVTAADRVGRGGDCTENGAFDSALWRHRRLLGGVNERLAPTGTLCAWLRYSLAFHNGLAQTIPPFLRGSGSRRWSRPHGSYEVPTGSWRSSVIGTVASSEVEFWELERVISSSSQIPHSSKTCSHIAGTTCLRAVPLTRRSSPLVGPTLFSSSIHPVTSPSESSSWPPSTGSGCGPTETPWRRRPGAPWRPGHAMCRSP